MKVSVSYVNAHLRVTPAEEDSSSQWDRITCSVDTSQPLSPAITVVTQWARERSGHGGGAGGYAWAQQQGQPFDKAHLSGRSHPADANTELAYGTIPPGGPASYLASG